MKHLSCAITLLLARTPCPAQVQCVLCFDQNAPVYPGTTNLVLNGSFENHTCGPLMDLFCPNSVSYGCDIDDWTCTGGGPDTYAQLFNTIASIIPHGSVAPYLGNYMSQSCSGVVDDTTCFAANGCQVVPGPPAGHPYNTPAYGGALGVTLAQDVGGLNAGGVYVLEFWAGGEGAYSVDGLFAVNVGFGNIFLRNRNTFPTPGVTGTRFVIVFAADSTTHTISFTNWGHACSSCTELVLDDVRLFNAGEEPCVNTVPGMAANAATPAWPNPALDRLTVQADPGDRMTVRDLHGRLLQVSEGPMVPIEQLAPGVYLLEQRSRNGVIVHRFEKQ